MSNALTPQNLTVSTVPNIDLDQIQGDVLIGLQKLAEKFLFFQIKDVAGFKTLLRKQIAHRITITRTVQEREFHLRDHKDQGNAAPPRARTMDEPVPNYPTGNVRSTLNEPSDFIVPTAAGYFIAPSIEPLTNDLSA
ncbi:MAG: hypothetical protein ACHQLQ_15640 [Candidatus Acidiferrales bacterium]